MSTRTLCSFLVVLCACGDEAAAPTEVTADVEATEVAPDVPADAAPDAFEWPLAQIDWQPCVAADATPLECADVPVPFDWDDPASPTMTIGVTRKRAPGAVDMHVWIIGGGPGQPVSDGIDVNYLVPLQAHLAAAGKNAVLYGFDQRGSGRSLRLSCPSAEGPDTPGGARVWKEEMATCAAELEGLGDLIDVFQPTRVARDLDYLIRSTRGPGEKVFVQGGSFGSNIALRYLQIDPDGIDGVVLSAVCAPTTCGLWSRLEDAEEAGEQVMADCALDPVCRERLGADPYARVVEVFDQTRGGEHCPEIAALDPELRFVQRTFRNAFDRPERLPLIAAVTYRLARCEPRDVEALTYLHYRFSQTPAETFEPPSFLETNNLPLLYTIHASELPDTGHPLAEDAYVALRDELHFYDLLPDNFDYIDFWPTYPPDPGFVGAWPETDLPVLIINGMFDNRTPMSGAELVAQTLGPSARLVSMPRTGHTVLRTSYQSGSTTACGMGIAEQFLLDPAAELDLSCRERVYALDYEDGALAFDWFNADDLWE